MALFNYTVGYKPKSPGFVTQVSWNAPSASAKLLSTDLEFTVTKDWETADILAAILSFGASKDDFEELGSTAESILNGLVTDELVGKSVSFPPSASAADFWKKSFAFGGGITLTVSADFTQTSSFSGSGGYYQFVGAIKTQQGG